MFIPYGTLRDRQMREANSYFQSATPWKQAIKYTVSFHTRCMAEIGAFEILPLFVTSASFVVD